MVIKITLVYLREEGLHMCVQGGAMNCMQVTQGKGKGAFTLACCLPLCRSVNSVCHFIVTALTSHAAMGSSQSGIAPELN